MQYSEDAHFEEVLMVRAERDYPERLYTKLLLNETIVEFQLDSGVSVNVLPESTYVRALGLHTKLRPWSPLYTTVRTENILEVDTKPLQRR